MSSAGDPWAVASDAPPAANDPWGTDQGGWSPSEDQAREAVQTIAPGATITSQGRSADHNAAVGGVPDSMHLYDQAADIVLPKGLTGAQFKKNLQDQGYPITEFLDEGTHIHWGWGPKNGKASTVASDPWAPAGPPNDGHWHNTPQENADLDAFEAAQKGLPADKTQPSATWWDTVKAVGKNAWPNIKAMAGGALEAFGEHPEAFAPSNPLLSEQENEEINAGLAPARGAAGKAMAAAGKQIFNNAQAQIKANMPNLDDAPGKRLAYTLASGTIQMLPILAGTAVATVTKSPQIAAATVYGGGAYFAATGAASKYGEARADGRTADQAAMDASFTGLVNGALGTLPLGALMKPGQTFLAKTLQGAATFGAVSVATEALQLGYDKGLVNPNMTLSQAMQRLEEAGIVGTLQGAFLGGGHAGLESAVNRLHAATPATPARVEPAPASTVTQKPEPAPAPAQAKQGSIHADVRSALGLETPGKAPAADPWAPDEGYRTNPGAIAAEHAAEVSQIEAQGTQDAARNTAAAVDGPGIARRALESDVAVTSSGREVPVQYAIVEASHLVPSQTHEGNPNPAFPAELQPRDRTRAVSQAQVASIAQNINPRLLDRSVNASDGAPIVAQSGVVESGNGRSLAIQRAYAENLPSAQAYRDYLAQRGYPVDGMEQPVLVRIRTDSMSPVDRQAFVREANQAGQLGYSATERAMSDAAAMPDHALDLFRSGDVEGAGNREFVRAFMAHTLPANEHAAMVDPNGNLSLDGARRVRAALLAKAYADPDLVGNVVENSDSSIKAIGNALTDTAADWAKMRAGIARGEIPASLDQTSKLLEAVQLVARARRDGRNVAEFVGQPDIFTGQSIDPDTEAWLRLMFRNTKDWTQPVGRDKLAEALQFYAREAQKAQVGANLLGEQPVSPGEVLSAAKARQYGEQSSGTGPSLSFGEDLRARRFEGDRSGFESPETGRGAQAAQPGAEGVAEENSLLGPTAPDFRTERPKTHGDEQSLSSDLSEFAAKAGADLADPKSAVGTMANYLLLRGHATGTEALAYRMANGSVGSHTINLPKEVRFGALLSVLKDPKAGLVTIHNHPSSWGPSRGDVASLGYPGHAVMAVVGHDGSWYMHRLAAEPISSSDVVRQALHDITQEVGDIVERHLRGPYNKRTISADEAESLHHRITAQSLDRAGITDYLTNVPALDDRIQPVIDKALKEGADAARARAESGQAIRPIGGSDRVHRPAGEIRFGDGIAILSGEPASGLGGNSVPVGARRGDGGIGAPRKAPEQLRLLEDAERYGANDEEIGGIYNAIRDAVGGFFKDVERDGTAQYGPGLVKAAGDLRDYLDRAGVAGMLANPGEWRVLLKKYLDANEAFQTNKNASNVQSLREEKNRYEADRPPFYSALTRSIEDVKMSRAPAKDWLGLIDNLRAKGVKQEEIDWSGVKDWVAQQTGPVTRDKVLQHLRENEVHVQEVGRGGNADAAKKKLNDLRPQFTDMLERHGRMGFDTLGEASSAVTKGPDAWDYDTQADADLAHHYAAAFNLSRMARPEQTKFSAYTLPGGENYRELLLTLPEKTGGERGPKGWGDSHGGTFDTVNFRSSHFDEPNILAHIRFDDRTGPNGEKVLHVAEIQSDMHQSGRRKGYRGEAPKPVTVTGFEPQEYDYAVKFSDGSESRVGKGTIGAHATMGDIERYFDNIVRQKTRDLVAAHENAVPDAPFKTSWQELAAKRMLRYAAEHGYDRLSWDTGETQADRYDLSKQVSRIDAERRPDGNYGVEIFGKDGTPVGYRKSYTPVELAEHVGKDLADKITKDLTEPGAEKSYKGLDLKVGGAGMKGFYDKILPAFLNKYAKKWGAKVEDAELGGKIPVLIKQNSDGSFTGIGANGKALTPNLPSRDAVKDFVRKKDNAPAPVVHSLPITDAMRESVMQGQPLFEDRRRYAEEPGAVDAQGRPLPQSIIPGAEPSAVQLAKARDGRMGSKAEQKPPGGLFGAQGVPGDAQLSLFEDGRRYGEIPRDERETLEKAARTGDWIGKYAAEGGTPDARIRNAIAGAFQAWRRSAGSVPAAVRTIFGRLGGGGGRGNGGGNDGDLPDGFRDVPTGRPTELFSQKVKQVADAAMDLVHDAQMLVAPMAEGTPESRATAKDFANLMRLARWHGNRMMEGLKKSFTPEQRRKMWEAADEESVLRQNGEATAGRGLSTLTPEERRAVLEQQADAQNVWQAAKDQNMVQGEGLPSYVPRMMVEMARGGAQRLGSGEGEVRSIPGIGRNLKTQTGQMKHRKYLTTEETEAAGSKKFAAAAQVVRDIQTLPLATMKLREAVAGRALINKIKEIGQKTGDDTVVEGHEPAGTPYKWFTLDNPAFKTWRPKLIKNEESGKYEPAKDQNGDIIFEKVPLFVRGDFEGPLRSVLSLDSGKIYNGLMNMKGRAMTAIMYSPLIHNAVEWGRALPAMPGKVATFRIYFEGNRAKRDPETMTQAILHGLVPIGHQAGMQDITSIANVDSIKAGRSWTAKIVGAVPGLFSRDAQQAVYRTIDKMGDLWHNTLLWDRVGDLQMGLYTNFRDHLIAKGNSPDAAAYMAAHFANRYAGALPLESMSTMARKIANLTLFSRTYTLGNLGAMKDVITGLPRDVQAQIARDGTLEQLKGVRSLAARKAIAILATDIALFYAGNSILQSAVSAISGRQDLNQIEQGYVDRLKDLLGKVTESPLELLNPFADMQALSATSENEPGRQNRIFVGYDHNGTAIYARNPVGKIGEEFTNWLTSPLETLKSKFSTILRPTYQVITNDAGFGRQVYDPKAKGLSGLVTNLGHIVSLYLSSQVPLESLKSAGSVLKGSASEIDTYKTLGPLAGVTFSKGAPGGPGVGELFELRRQRDAAQAAAMPIAIEKIKKGDIAGARADMRAVGISPGLQNYYVRVTQNPRLRLNTRSARELLRQATPEERARILQSNGDK